MPQRDSRELLRRYLNALEGYLPRKQRADIVAELSDTLQSQMEEHEAELGHPLDVAEQSEILKPLGPPAVAASRYWSRAQLIGPVLLPYYWNTLKIVLLFALAVDLIALFTGAITGGSALSAFARVWGTAWLSFFLIVGVVTTIFFAIDRLTNADALVRKWDPQKLPRISRAHVPRSTSLVELVLNTTFVLWLLDVPFVRNTIGAMLLNLSAASSYALAFRFSPAWQWGLFALVAVSIAHAVINAVNLIRPDWARLRAGAFVVTNGVIVGVILFMMQSRPLISLADPSQAARYGSDAQTLDVRAVWILAWIALTCLIIAFVYARNFVRLSAPKKLSGTNMRATAL